MAYFWCRAALLLVSFLAGDIPIVHKVRDTFGSFKARQKRREGRVGGEEKGGGAANGEVYLPFSVLQTGALCIHSSDRFAGNLYDKYVSGV